MSTDRREIQDKKDLMFLGSVMLNIILISFGLIFFITGEVVPCLLLSYTLIAWYAIILLRNIEVIEPEQHKMAWRQWAYIILIIYPFYMIGMIWVYFFY